MSEVIVFEAALLSLPFLSLAAPAATLTVTAPSAVGATLKVKVLSSTATKLETVPFVTATSLASKPVTFSLKVILKGIDARFVGSEAVVAMVGTGPVVSGIEGRLMVTVASFETRAGAVADGIAEAVARQDRAGSRCVGDGAVVVHLHRAVLVG